MSVIIKSLRKLSDDDIRQIMREYEWATDDRVIDAALSVVRAALTLPSKPLDDILLEVTLNSLVFVYDRELLIRTKQWISREWKEIDDSFLLRMNRSIGGAIQNQVYPPNPRLDPQKQPLLYGLSLVVTFEYPKGLKDAIIDHLTRIPCTYFTSCNHFTVLNIGTEIPPTQVARIRNLVIQRISGKLTNDYRLNGSIREALTSLQIRPEIRMIPDGSIVLFGSGSLLEAIYELKLKLRKDLFSLDIDFDPRRDRQPIWIYTVFARIGRPIEMPVVAAMATSYKGFQKTHPAAKAIPLFNSKKPKLGLLTFGDHKAILPPVDFHDLSPV